MQNPSKVFSKLNAEFKSSNRNQSSYRVFNLFKCVSNVSSTSENYVKSLKDFIGRNTWKSKRIFFQESFFLEFSEIG